MNDTDEDRRSSATIETFPTADGWRNRVAGGDTYPETFEDEGRAVELGRSIARDARVDHVVLDQEGEVVERHSYADAPPHADEW